MSDDSKKHDAEQDRLWRRAVSRREALLTVGGLTAALATACSGSSTEGTGNTDGTNSGKDSTSGVDMITTDMPVTSCTVYPQQTAGPFYLDLNMLRNDITEGLSGIPLTLVIQVLGSDGCSPLPNIAVDIWHCDVAGRYSGFPGQPGNSDTSGEKWLRGTQISDSEGRVSFQTIYPGWYPGRTTHIHFRVYTSNNTAALSQLYFPEATNDAVYQLPPYATRGAKDTANTADGIFMSDQPALLQLSGDQTGYSTSVALTVQS